MKLPLSVLKREDFSEIQDAWMDKLLRPLNTQFRALSQILNGGVVLGDNVQGYFHDLDVTMRDGWTALTLTNGWTSNATYPAPAYRMIGDEVVLRGVADAGALAGSVATLPTGYRPAMRRIFVPSIGAGAVAQRVDVYPDGQIYLISAPVGTTFATLETVRFDATGTPPQTFNAAFPQRFKNELPGQRRPSVVLVCSALDTTGGVSVPVSVGSAAWSTSADQIVIHDVAGLVANRRYQLTFFVT